MGYQNKQSLQLNRGKITRGVWRIGATDMEDYIAEACISGVSPRTMGSPAQRRREAAPETRRSHTPAPYKVYHPRRQDQTRENVFLLKCFGC